MDREPWVARGIAGLDWGGALGCSGDGGMGRTP